MPAVPPSPPDRKYSIATPPIDGALAQGDVYTDGALRGLVPCTRRAGWAYLVVSGGEASGGRCGTMGEPYPTALRAELRAVNEALRSACPPPTIHTDNQQVVDGVRLGKSWPCAPERDGADIWQRVWHQLEDIGPGMHIVKVKAHLPFSKVQDGHISLQDWCGNGVLIYGRWRDARSPPNCPQYRSTTHDRRRPWLGIVG